MENDLPPPLPDQGPGNPPPVGPEASEEDQRFFKEPLRSEARDANALARTLENAGWRRCSVVTRATGQLPTSPEWAVATYMTAIYPDDPVIHTRREAWCRPNMSLAPGTIVGIENEMKASRVPLRAKRKTRSTAAPDRRKRTRPAGRDRRKTKGRRATDTKSPTKRKRKPNTKPKVTSPKTNVQSLFNTTDQLAARLQRSPLRANVSIGNALTHLTGLARGNTDIGGRANQPVDAIPEELTQEEIDQTMQDLQDVTDGVDENILPPDAPEAEVPPEANPDLWEVPAEPLEEGGDTFET